MRSGRGALHEEFWETRPDRTTRIELFQLWINLPSHLKMQPAAIRYVGDEWGAAYDTQRVVDASGKFTTVRTALDGPLLERAHATSGGERIEPRPAFSVLHATLQPGASWCPAVDPGHTVMLYVRQGRVVSSARAIEAGSSCFYVRDGGNAIALTNTDSAASDVLLLTGAPLHEPVALGGPIVMNTEAELQLAYRQLRDGTFL